MTRSQDDYLGFIGALTGLLFQPIITIENLLFNKRYIYIVPCLVGLFGAVFIPIFVQLYNWHFLETKMVNIFSLFLTVMLTGAFFLIIEILFLQMLGIRVKMMQLFATFAYSLMPLIPLILCYYCVNYALYDRLTVVTFMITGVKDSQDYLISYFPVMHIIGHVLCLAIFYGGVRFVGQLGDYGALIATIFSLIPFYIAFFVSLAIVDTVYPGTMVYIKDLLFSFTVLLSRM